MKHPAIPAEVVGDLAAQNAPDFRPDPAEILEAAAALVGRLGAAAEDAAPTALLVIDPQVDFCYPEGALHVGGRSGSGAADDLGRLAAWYWRNAGAVTTVAASMDEHWPYQIFHPAFWLTEDGRHPAPFTQVTLADLESGQIRLDPAVYALAPRSAQAFDKRDWAEKQAHYYLSRLAENERYDLTIWPFHCLKGSTGQNVAPIVRRFMLFHAFARGAQPVLITKGDNPWTESYSAIGPEVATAFDGTPLVDLSGVRPESSVQHLVRTHGRIVIAGEAASHCVAWTLSDMVRMIERQHFGRAAPDIYVLTDCMSPVVVKDGAGNVIVDHTEGTDKVLSELAERPFVHLVTSESDLADWSA